MSSIPAIPTPHIDPSLYAWQPHPTPRLYLRRALGPETKWVHLSVENRQLFLSGTITFKSPLSSIHEFSAVAVDSWMRLRFSFPEVVLKFSGEFVGGNAIMECQIPRTDGEANDWAKRTSYLEDTVLEADPMLSAERQMREHDVSDPVCLQLNAIASQDADNEHVLGSEFCFRVDHQLADGMGVYILAGNFFKILAGEVGREESEKIEWAKAAENIPEPWVRMMNANQKAESKHFEERGKKNAELVLESVNSEWGLKIQPGQEYTPKSIQNVFSVDQSKAILRSVKSEIGPAASVTHLGHAAMAMTVLKFKPAEDRPSNSDRFVSPLFMSGRRYLDPSRPKSTDHVPICRAVGAIEFRKVERYLLSGNGSKAEVRQKLRIACEEARRSYQAIREQKSLLTESFAVAEFIGTAKNVVKDKGTIDPLFLSDGIVEQFISRSYTDMRDNEVLTVDDVHFTANPDGPPLIIRMCTFRDTIRVAAEWNGAFYDGDEIRRFLDSVTELMLSLT